ncbi:MAG: SCO family protein [Caldilineaceae bacterium]
MAAVDTGGIPVQLVTISFDPERDSPEVLRQYADALGADIQLALVTGEPTRLKNVIGRGFSTFYEHRGRQLRVLSHLRAGGRLGHHAAKYRTGRADTEIVSGTCGC